MKAGLVACALLALTVTPACASAYSDFNSGIAARNARRCDLAVTHENAALAAPDLLASFKPTALLVRGDCQLVAGKVDAAIADFTAALALKPDDIQLHTMRGMAFEFLKRDDSAVADYQDIVRLRPDLTRGYIRLGNLYTARNQTEAAIAQYSALIAAQPEYAVGYLLRSRAHLVKGDFESAIGDADHMVRMVPQDATGYVQRAVIYQAQGKFDLALSDLDDALDRRKGDTFTSLLKGTVQWELGHFADAQETLDPLAKNDLTTGYALLWLSLARGSAGKPDDDLAARSANLDRAKWPAPLVSLYAGQSTVDAVMAGVARTTAENRERDACESDFYVGEWQLRHQAKDAGIALLQKAAGDCPVTYVERAAAAVELGRSK